MTYNPPITVAAPPNRDEGRVLIERVLRDLAEQIPELNKYRDYYSGRQKISFGTDKFKTRFGSAFTGFRDNWMDVVVDAVADKLTLIGFRLDTDTDGTPTSTSSSPVDRIWNVMRDNDIDEQAVDLHVSTLVEGRAYMVVWPDPELGARIDMNSAQVMTVRYDENVPGRIAMAVKRWRTPSDQINITVYYPNRIEKYRQRLYEDRGRFPAIPGGGGQLIVPSSTPDGTSLERRLVPNELWPLPNPFGEVPVVEFTNYNGSEIRDAIPLQDGLNYILMQMFVTGEFQSFKQRVFMGANDAPAGGWQNDPGTVWQIPPALDAEGKPISGSFGELSGTDPDTYIKVAEMFLEHIALSTKTPTRFFKRDDRGGRGDAPSGESQKISDQPLLDKVKKRATKFGNQWSKVANLVARASTSQFNTPNRRFEPVWENVEATYRMALLEEAKAMMEVGVPNKFIWRKIGLTPEEIEQVEQLAEEQQREEDERKRAEMQMQTQIAAANRPPSPNQ